MKTNPDKDPELHNKINSETARLPWSELVRHFAQGTVIFVSPELDLIDVAVRISHDDKDSIAGWMKDGRSTRSAMNRRKPGPRAGRNCGRRW